jgi:hypothetical protein
MLGNLAGNTGTIENAGDFFGMRILRAENQIAAPDVFYRARLRNGSGNINRGGQRGEPGSGVDLVGVVHTVLHADQDCARREKLSELPGSLRVVGGFDAKQNDLGAARGGEFRAGFDPDTLLELHRIEE